MDLIDRKKLLQELEKKCIGKYYEEPYNLYCEVIDIIKNQGGMKNV